MMLTIVTYHYVRDPAKTAYPRIKTRITEEFEAQLDYLIRHYELLDVSDVIHAVGEGTTLPQNACLLTFDDGLADHFDTVLPLLVEREITGSFYPVAAPIAEAIVLDVHKIQFILASVTDHGALKRRLIDTIDGMRHERQLPPTIELEARYSRSGRWDDETVSFIKATLQWALPVDVRSAIVDEFFRVFVTDDETSFVKDLYMGPSQLRELIASGMTVGGHGYSHVHLGTLSRSDQRRELARTKSFLEQLLGAPPMAWVMCYPYGSYNADTIELVGEFGAVLGLTCEPMPADVSRPLELARVDTNDLPVHADAPAPSFPG